MAAPEGPAGPRSENGIPSSPRGLPLLGSLPGVLLRYAPVGAGGNGNVA
jgi:hypothetical protein